MRRNQRQPQPGIACRGFNDGPARREQPFALRFVNHRQRHAVLNGTARILVFKFQKKRAQAGVELVQLDNWRAANQFGDGMINRHGLFLNRDMAG
ncbi:hypothetical protein D3C71_1843060 [compost metagenome]